MNSNCPIGSDYDPRAPWNQEDQPNHEIEVTVSITLSKTVKVIVNDYTLWGKDENGNPDVDYSMCNLKSAVESQIYLPQEAGNFIQEGLDNGTIISTKYGNIAEDLKDWDVDDFEVVME